jgi:catechol 2,3-dioxygenase-like lactoylglutathione lyase family enzyme
MPIATTAPTIEVGIATVNAEAMTAFYGDFLGLESQGELAFPGGVQRRFSLGGNVLKLVTFDGATNGAAGVWTDPGYRYLTLYVGDLNEIADEVEASPYDLVLAPTAFEPVPGMGFMFIADPDGNRIELVGTV